MWDIFMIIDGEYYIYGSYVNRDKANLIAMQIRVERGVDTEVHKQPYRYELYGMLPSGIYVKCAESDSPYYIYQQYTNMAQKNKSCYIYDTTTNRRIIEHKKTDNYNK